METYKKTHYLLINNKLIIYYLQENKIYLLS